MLSQLPASPSLKHLVKESSYWPIRNAVSLSFADTQSVNGPVSSMSQCFIARRSFGARGRISRIFV